MSEQPEAHTTVIGHEKFHDLHVEWMTYRYHPHQHRVSLLSPGTKAFGMQMSRLVNMSPQTALNLLAWLEQERAVLEALRDNEASQMTKGDSPTPG
jgi:hypothetical protein